MRLAGRRPGRPGAGAISLRTLLAPFAALAFWMHGFLFCCDAEAETKTFLMDDGATIQADLQSRGQSGRGLVILLPMLGHTKQDYKPLLEELGKRGFSTLALDLRGHGQSTKRSGGGSLDYRHFQRSDWAKLPSDLNAVIRSVSRGDEKKLSEKIFIVGASIGANAAALSAAANPNVAAIVLLSPGADYHGLKPEDAISRYKGHVFLAVSREDAYSFESCSKFAKIDGNRITMRDFTDSGHGTDMFAKQPKLPVMIAAWLAEGSTK